MRELNDGVHNAARDRRAAEIALGCEHVDARTALQARLDGVPIEIDGIRATHVPPGATKIELLPRRRRQILGCDRAPGLPEEMRGPIGDTVLDRLVEF